MKHYDCKYYLALDVFKGICKRDKSPVNADDAACDSFEKARKCKHCANFRQTETDLGNCMNTYDAFPEMMAVTCNDFRSN